MKNKKAYIIVCLLILLNMYNVNLFADIGPKPSLDINVQNIYSRDYYLDVLVPGDDEFYSEFSRHYSDHEAEYKELPIYKYRTDNWMAKNLRDNLLFGSIQGEYNNQTKMMLHHFSYHGVPQTFKIIIQYTDGELWVSDVINTNQFNATVLLDMNTGKPQVIDSLHMGFIGNTGELIKMVSICLLLTLIIELLIAIPMKIRPLKVVALANIISQSFLHIVLISLFYAKQYQYMNTVFLLLEVLVLFIEYYIFTRYTTNISTKKLISYVLIANISTFLIGLLINI